MCRCARTSCSSASSAARSRAAGSSRSIWMRRGKIPGVVGLYTVDDVPGEKHFGPLFKDEPVLADGEVLYVGQPVVVIAAETREALRAAQRAIKIDVDARRADPVDRAGNRIGPVHRTRAADCPRRCGGRAEISAAPAHGRVPQSGAGAVLSRIAGRDRLSRASKARWSCIRRRRTRAKCKLSWPKCSGSRSIKSSASASGWAAASAARKRKPALPAMMAALVAAKTGRAARLDLQQRRRHGLDR